MSKTSQLRLGASLYVPTTQAYQNLVDIGNGEKFPLLRSVIFCTEDAVRAEQLEQAMKNLRKALPCFKPEVGPMRFIRVRNPEILAKCLRMSGIQNIDGFVLPKVTADNLQYYLAQLTERDTFVLMPTIETKEAFNDREMTKLRDLMTKDPYAHDRILCLRIGGNDLLNCLGVRRNPARTIYQSPVGDVIKRLAGIFIPYGFGLTAPVCECIENTHILEEEVHLDVMCGLFGKTAIHPSQIEVIEAGFRVCPRDLEEAQLIVHPDAEAVFKHNGRMCEPATHTRWANSVIERSEIYGVLPAD